MTGLTMACGGSIKVLMGDRRPRVLIFDDDELVRELLGAICERRGYEVVTFANPGICPLNAEHDCPCGPEEVCADVIFSDLQMPVVKGVDFLEALLGKGCHCKHIALVSGSCECEEVARARRLGLKFIPKPFRPREIEQWLDEFEHSMAGSPALHNL